VWASRAKPATGEHTSPVLESPFVPSAQIDEVGIGKRKVMNMALAQIHAGDHQTMGISVRKVATELHW